MTAKSHPQERNIGIIGLGLVGSALAGRLLNAGYTVFGYDIDPKRCEELEAKEGTALSSCPAVVECSQRIILSLPNSDIVREVTLEENGIISTGVQGSVILDTTTGDPSATVDIARKLSDGGNRYIDACIIGSSQQVEDGDVVVVMGGSEEDIAACEDLLGIFAREVFHMGENGKGCEAKLVVNLVLGLNRLVLSEGLLLAESLGMDLEKTLDLLKSGAAYSRVMDTKGKKMLFKDYAPQARLSQHLKDVRLILEQGKTNDVHLHLSDLHRRILEAGVESGLGDYDNSAVFEILRRRLLEKSQSENER